MTFDVREGDVLERLADLADNSFDAVLSDPPYGLSPDGKARTTDEIAEMTSGSRKGFMGKAWDAAVPGVSVWREVLRVLKPGGYVLAFGGTRTFHRMTCAIEDAGFEIRDCLMWIYGQGFPKSLNGPWGGTALKPGWEPITLARKPLDGTMANNVAKWGVGGLAIDACRIGEFGYPASASPKRDSVTAYGNGLNGDKRPVETPGGRWPANLLLDEEAGALLDEQSGERPGMSGGGCHREGYGGGMFGGIDGNAAHARGDSGGASRFFQNCSYTEEEFSRFMYCAKVSRAEREAGCEQLKRLSSKEISGREEGAAGAKHGRGGAAANGGVSNHHPTLKPIALTTYLAKLLLPPSPGRILVPYSGAGSEMIGCLKAGWPDVLGIELSPEYIEIARARITHALAEAPKKERKRKATRPPRKRPPEPPMVSARHDDGRQLPLFAS